MRYVNILCLLLVLTTPALADTQKLNQDLTYKALFGRAGEVQDILGSGANPNAIDTNGTPALAIAAGRKDLESLPIMDVLLKKGATIDAKDMNGDTALFHAARKGNIDAVKFLLDNGADFYATNNKGQMARNVAHAEGQLQVFNFMDKYQEDKRQAVLEKYNKINNDLKEKQRELNESRKELEEKQRLLDIQATREATDDTTPKADNAKALQSFQEQVRRYSFANCAFQYWNYARSVKLKSEIDEDAVTKTMDKYNKEADELAKAMMEQRKVSAKYLEKIANPSRNQITKELRKFGSNSTLRSNNVGTLSDAKTRCDRVATQWEVSEPAALKE